MSKYLKDREGRFVGSVGDGKSNVPTVAQQRLDGATVTAALHHLLEEDTTVSLQDLYAAYVASRAEEGDVPEVEVWPSELSVGVQVPATYESHLRLPVGSVVRLSGSQERAGYRDGFAWVKTGESTWASLGNRADAPGLLREKARDAIEGHDISVSPCPLHGGGVWTVEEVFVAGPGYTGYGLWTLDEARDFVDDREASADRLQEIVDRAALPDRPAGDDGVLQAAATQYRAEAQLMREKLAEATDRPS